MSVQTSRVGDIKDHMFVVPVDAEKAEDVFVAGDLPGFEKLDFPYVVCPASMPGFSNYLPSKYESSPDSRKVAYRK